MTEPMRPTENGQRVENRAGAVPSRSTSHAQALDALHDLHEQGHLADIDRHFAALVAELGDAGPEVPLAAALASAWTRDGHACISLAEVAGRDWPRVGAVRLPDLDAWIDALGASPMVARPGDAQRRPLVLDGEGRLYLERLWTAEQMVAASLRERSRRVDPVAGAASAADERHERNGLESETDSESGSERKSEQVPAGLDVVLDRLFPGSAADDRARTAARTAVRHRLCVVSGGPGTGKTTIAAAIVALLIELRLASPDRIGLVAPTGKAAARLQEAVRGRHRTLVPAIPALEGFEARATTVHRWLFSRVRVRSPIDALILDEGSMIDLTLMARVLGALPDDARFVVLGDASQLASVQPGAVFADVCRAGTGAGEAGRGASAGPESEIGAGPAKSSEGTPAEVVAGDRIGSTEVGAEAKDAHAPASSPLAPCVVQLIRNWRFDDEGGIGRLAAAVVRGDAAATIEALGDRADDAIGLWPLTDPGRFERLATTFADKRFAPALELARAAEEPGNTALPPSSFRVLCAHRVGPYGAERFNRLVERRLQALGLVPANEPFYPGRPILVTRNDPRTGLSNGDTGIVLRDADGRVQVWFPELEDSEGHPRLVAPARLPPHVSFFAVTVHRAQGSEYDEVAVLLGPAESRVATRELLYTAVTRARKQVAVYGTEVSVEAAVEQATERISGLWDALAES